MRNIYELVDDAKFRCAEMMKNGGVLDVSWHASRWGNSSWEFALSVTTTSDDASYEVQQRCANLNLPIHCAVLVA